MPAPRGSEVWRDFVTDMVPSSGVHQPSKADARAWSAWLESLVTSGVLSSGPWFATQASMTLGYAANTVAVVYADPDAAKNGLYRKNGTSGAGTWSQLTSFLPGYQFVTASPTSASTPNAIVAVTSPRLPAGDGVALVTLSVPAMNTGSSVSIRFDGGASLTIKDVTGADIVAGGLLAGMTLAGFVSGDTFRLITDYASAAHEAAAAAARDDAEAARDQAAGYVNEIVAEKEVPIYGTANGLAAIIVPAGLMTIRTNGRAAMGDGGAYLLKEVPEDGSPLTANQFRSNTNSRRWEIADDGSVRSDVNTGLSDGRQARALRNIGLGGFSAAIQRKLRTVLAKVANGDGQKLMVLGDSTNAGVGGSEHPGNSWGTAKYHTPIFVAAQILQASGIECRTDAFIGGSGMGSVTQYSQYNGRCVGFGGSGWSVETGFYAGGSYFQQSGWFGPNNALIFTPLKAADRFDIYYISNSGTGEFTVSDGGATLGVFPTAGAPGVKKVTISRSTASLDPVKLFLTAVGFGYIVGIDPWNSSLPELRILNLAVSGWRAGYYTVSTLAFSARPALNAFEPDYTYIEFGINDKGNGDSLGGFLANMRILIEDRLPKGVALGISAPTEAGLAGNLPPAWRNAIADLAEEYGMPCIDHYTVFGSYEINPDLYFDTIHPNRGGYGVKGRTLSNWMAT